MGKTLIRRLLSTTLNACGLMMVVTACAGAAFGRNGHNVPEIDPTSATSALTMLIGGLLMLTGRQRNK
jgi:hypothetical protein